MEWLHFGLDRQPFRPTVDPDSYFAAETHGAAMSALAGAFARRDHVVLIDGAPGVGKSIVSRKWLEGQPSAPRVIVPNACAGNPAELLQAILFDLSKPFQGLTEQELRLAVTEHLLDESSRNDLPTVLLLDEAHHLCSKALEELRLLGNLETRGGSALFTLLVAHESIRDRLHESGCAAFMQRVAARATIRPLSVEESTDYLRHQVRSAGGDPARVFTADATPILVAASGGVPRLLNRTAALALELAARGESDQIDVEAAMEAVSQLGLAEAEPVESAEPVLLPHPARSRRKKPIDVPVADEADTVHGSKHKVSRKRTA